MFEFQEDWYNATAVAALVLYDNSVMRVCLFGVSEPIQYEYDDDDERQKARNKFVAAWQKAVYDEKYPVV